jgi:hypothetical protein
MSEADPEMSYCEHCQGQRFDRAQVLRALRRVREDVRRHGPGGDADRALALALSTVRALELPHLEPEEEEGQVVH